MRKPLPLVPGASAVGRVADPGTSGHAPGSRILLCGSGYGTKLDGTWREFAAVPVLDDIVQRRKAGVDEGAQVLANLLASMPIGHAKVSRRVLGKAVEAFAERLVVYLLPERK
jgi:NADPH:quinone reductase